MNRAIFIVPTFPPHYDFAYKLIDTYEKYEMNADLLFVFSSEEDRSAFNDRNTMTIAMPDDPTIHPGGAIVHRKKYFALDHASKTGYTHAIVLDSETEFSRSEDSAKFMQEFCDNKVFMSSRSTHWSICALVESPLKFYDEQGRTKLRELTSNCAEYIWYNELNVYDLRVFDKFYASLDLSLILPKDYDYIVYAYFCLLYEGYRVRSISDEIDTSLYANRCGSLLEIVGNRNQLPHKQEIVNLMAPHWMPKNAEETHPNVFVTFHHDRLS